MAISLKLSPIGSLAVAVVFLAYLGYSLKHERDATNWPEARGEVTDIVYDKWLRSMVDKSTPKNLCPYLTFQYLVDERIYTASTRYPSGECNAATESQLIRKVGQHVVVRYNPKSPREARIVGKASAE